MKVSEHVRDAILEAVENQINSKKPPETALTLKRLITEGHSDSQAKQLIGQAMAVEVLDSLNNRKPYNERRYLNNLKNLPSQPEE